MKFRKCAGENRALVPPDNSVAAPDGAVAPPAQIVVASPYIWRDPTTLPRRQWLFDKHYIRKFASATIAPGGLGKSSLACVEAVSMATGRDLLGVPVAEPLKVWIWNGEDPLDELERRIGAILLHYQIHRTEVEGRLFLNSGRDTPIIIAEKLGDKITVARPLVDALVREISSNKIDCVIIDPFVSSHGVAENGNGAIDRVIKTWARIADETNCAVDLVHHVRKPANGAAGAFTFDDARGAGAFGGGVRSARILNHMTNDEAEATGVALKDRKLHFRIDRSGGKANMQPPSDEATWRKLVSVPLDNGAHGEPGDWVGVATKWTMPAALDGVTVADLHRLQTRISEGAWRENAQAAAWAGNAIAETLDLDLTDAQQKAKVKKLLKTWIRSGALKIALGKTENDRHEFKFVEVGTWAV